MTNYHLFTSESVTEGHPDKVCDHISDAVVDAYIAQDPHAHTAIETCATAGQFVVFGEVKSPAYVNVPRIVREVLTRVGYTDAHIGLDADTVPILVGLGEQSSEINQGVDPYHVSRRLNGGEGGSNDGGQSSAECASEEITQEAQNSESRYELQGAGDQGLMFGYACDETSVLMPLPIVLAHRLAARLAYVRHKGIVPHLRPDGKTQVTVAYDESEKPVYVDTVVVSTQHDPEVSQEWIRSQVEEHVVLPVLEKLCADNVAYDSYKLMVNPTGSFVKGGPAADAGLTGRKIIVDTYGGAGRHGGGAFSGKDPSKVDRSAAYAARWVAKNVVAAGLATRAEVQVAYAIGVAEPVSVYINAFGTQTLPIDILHQAVREVFDLRPAAIIDELELLSPMYAKTAVYGHFGREDYSFPWENTDKVDALRHAIARLREGEK